LFKFSIKSSSGKIVKSKPLRNRFFYSIYGYIMILSRIVVLFIHTCPFAIIGRISFIIVNSFNSMFSRRSFTHVGIKVFKRIYPSITYKYISSTIIFVWFIFLVIASIFHGKPYLIFRAYYNAIDTSTVSMLILFSFYTTATFGIPSAYFPRFSNSFISASTVAKPKTLPIFSMMESNYFKIIKGFVCYVNKIFMHGTNIIKTENSVKGYLIYV